MKKLLYLIVGVLTFVFTSCCDAYTVETVYIPNYYTIHPYTRVIVSPTIRMHRYNRPSVRYYHYAEPPRVAPPRVSPHRR